MLVGNKVSRLCMSSGGLAVGFAGKDCSTTSCTVAKACAHFLCGCKLLCGLRCSQQTHNVSKG